MKFGREFNLFLFQPLISTIKAIFESFILFLFLLFNENFMIRQVGTQLSTSKQYLQSNLMYTEGYGFDLLIDLSSIFIFILDELEQLALGMKHVPSSLFILRLFLEQSNTK